MSANRCKECHHFLQHYTLDRRKLFRVHCGHCTHGRPKQKSPYDKACVNFLQGCPQENAFASKEYLSKELLQYLLHLPLLPEIEESE